MNEKDPARLVFEGREGDAIVVSLIDMGGRLRLICQDIHCVKPIMPMPNLPVARVTNLANTIEVLKAKNIWVYAADMDGEDYEQIDFDLPVAIVIGNEGKGIGALTSKKCDRIVSLPMMGKINSLNASVAAGILMYEAVRKRRKK